MLARIWDPPEAISIWMEIIAICKEEVKKKISNEGEVEHELLVAVVQAFPRTNIADWDAGVGTWLRVADTLTF